MAIEVLVPLIACISMLLFAIVIGIFIFLRESKNKTLIVAPLIGKLTEQITPIFPFQI